MKLHHITTILIGALLLAAWGPATVKARESLVAVKVNHHRQAILMPIQSLMVFPADVITVTFKTKGLQLASQGSLHAEDLPAPVPKHWSWRAPQKPGVYTLVLRQSSWQQQLNFVVQVPYNQMKRVELNGYRIGGYPQKRKIKNALYQHPEGFIEVTAENETVNLSPHFQLKQFLCKQHDAYPKYITIKEGLLTKLEALIRLIHQQGIKCTSLVVLSGYRTPYYNQLLGNVPYSAHLYGKAADIYIDEDHNGLMDDLNHDGSLDYRDAKILYQLVERLERTPMGRKLKGGLGLYGRTTTHSPFVHMDIRGYQARWGIDRPVEQARRKFGSNRKTD